MTEKTPARRKAAKRRGVKKAVEPASPAKAIPNPEKVKRAGSSRRAR